MRTIFNSILFSLIFNILGISQDRAPSLYLNYQDFERGDIIINTLWVGAPSPLYTYYCGLLWNGGLDAGGYCGLQEHPDGRNFIYSLWDPISTSEGITANYVHPSTDIANFGGEGTGLRSLNFGIGWKIEEWYTLVSRAWSLEDESTLFGFWVYGENEKTWHHLVTMRYPVGGLGFSSGTSSFIEDWVGNGNEARTVLHKKGWKRKSSDKEWIAFGSSYFDRVFPDAGTVNYIENYDGGVLFDKYFFMTSGGNTSPDHNEDDVLLFLDEEHVVPEPDFAKGDYTNLTVNKNTNTVTIDWEINQSKSPQFSYHIDIYDNSDLEGNPVFSIDRALPHIRNQRIDISTLEDNKRYYIDFSITDVFDNRSRKSIETFVKGISSTHDLVFEDISISPNPVNDILNISLGRRFDNLDLIITDINGRKISEHSFMDLESISLPIDLISGTYLIRLLAELEETTLKFQVN